MDSYKERVKACGKRYVCLAVIGDVKSPLVHCLENLQKQNHYVTSKGEEDLDNNGHQNEIEKIYYTYHRYDSLEFKKIH